MRIGRVERETRETKVLVELNVDGEGKAEVDTSIKYLDHLIKTLATHSSFDIKVEAKGDLQHHIIEDLAICLGESLNRALGERKGISRFGYAMVPMDESLAYVSVDLVRRPFCVLNLKIEKDNVEGIVREDIYHFIRSFTHSLQATVHIQVQYGDNEHHKVEAAFKALALALRQAVSSDVKRRDIPSSKGVM
ncbi:MAG: imidazoleglycerol-phosphate dehydratase HisB [Nitrososphaerota archaeon]|nr:imidazoleglycerol-phosphate dehydratase HisB [Nitrososphaerales archaeon]MDW8045381.1 imidazoleglycerol-phosphate dehydratase HisB [Nitrososphaerota archaeon]